MTRENAHCKNRCLIKAGLAIGFVMAGGLGRAETTRELRDGKYWIDVPADETYTLAESDVDVLVPDEGAQPELWKIGAGTLEMTTNGLSNCAKMMSYNAANIEALDAWTVVCPEKGVRVKRTGHVLTAEVSSGFMVIMR